VSVSDAARANSESEPLIDADDEAWLQARLQEYRELLVYLQEH
jgi:hypothetical protein